jgi:hypothetical protein
MPTALSRHTSVILGTAIAQQYNAEFMGWTTGESGFDSGQVQDILRSVKTDSGPSQPPIQWISELLPGVRRPGVKPGLRTHRLIPSLPVSLRGMVLSEAEELFYRFCRFTTLILH